VDDFITLYQQRLNLQHATFSRIDHEDAMVAIVYKITQTTEPDLILKICTRPKDYLHEVYFLKHLVGIIPVPRILKVVEPKTDLHGAILMECLPGTLLKNTDLTGPLAYELGCCLARIHLNRVEGYGDLTQPQDLNPDPRVYFTLKFEEGFAECFNHLPKTLLDQCRHYYDTHVNLLLSADGPCMVHRDFRPGNILVDKGKLQGIIDWASGRASFAQEDFCLIERGEWSTDPAHKKSFLAGYASIRPVPDYTTMMPLLLLSKAFATVGFTVKQNTWNNIHARVYESNRRFLETFFQTDC
jgi:Ser/Thr protein kinase RdoA (MazF antagonist)